MRAKGSHLHFFHKWVELGAFINAGKPAGGFVVPDHTSPMVLISAGVGITPMVSARHALAKETPVAMYFSFTERATVTTLL